MFTCPRCNQNLERCETKTINTSGGVYWRCGKCGGRTATIAMVRQLADQNFFTQIWEEVNGPFAPDSLPCPTCRSNMKAVWLPASCGNCQIDVCLRCYVVWFDAEEFERIPSGNGTSLWDNKNIPLEARLAMARLHVESLDPHPDFKLDSEPPAENWKAIPAFFGLPVKNEPSVSANYPWGTWCAVAAIVGIGTLSLVVKPRMYQDFGFIPAEWNRLGYLTILTTLFLYGSIPHLVTSAYFLLTFGDDVENYFGTARFMILLLVSAICGNLAHLALHPSSQLPLLGAGPAVSGLLTAYGLRFPSARIGFIFRLPVIIYRWINLPAWLYILFWIGTQAIGAAVSVEDIRQVSWSAHLGGALAGGLLGLLPARHAANSPVEETFSSQ